MFAYLHAHQVEFWFALGAVALIIEITILGAGSFVLLFMGIGALATGLLMALGLLPELWVAGLIPTWNCLRKRSSRLLSMSRNQSDLLNR